MPNAMPKDEADFLNHIATLVARKVAAGELFSNSLVAAAVEDYRRQIDEMRADMKAQNERHSARYRFICQRTFQAVTSVRAS